MKNPACTATVALLSVLTGSGQGSESHFVIARHGQPQARIIVFDQETTGPLIFAARELRRYVNLMSGAELTIASQPNAQNCIIVTARPSAASKLGADNLEPLNEDHYLLQSKGDRLFIVGASPRAALYGVYDLLERLGCGWCVPGDDTVPHQPTLTLGPLHIDTAPAFKYRMMLDYPLQTVAQSLAIVDWIAKNRMNWVHPCPNADGEPVTWYARRERVAPAIKDRGLSLIFGGHTMHTWVPSNEFRRHPEWFAFNDGKREGPTLCLTNSEMETELISNMRRFLDRCPEVDVVDLWHPDSEVFCHCPACTRGLLPEATQGKLPAGMPDDAVRTSYVITYLEFMNRVAARIKESHPRIMLSPLLYGPTDRAMPDGAPPLADNLLPGLAHMARDSYRPLAGEPKSAANMRILGDDLTWMAKSRQHFIYEYYNPWTSPFIYPGSRVIVRDLQILKEVGAQGASSDMFGYSPINMYVAARALWSPEVDWEATVRDYCRCYYGDVADDMARNWIELENGVYGKAGYLSSGALDGGAGASPVESGDYFKEERPAQIEFLEKILAKVKDPQVRVRVERALRPWKVWGDDARWWAFPKFQGE